MSRAENILWCSLPLTTKNKNRANYCNILSAECHDRLSIGRLSEWVCIVSAMHSNWLHLLLVAVWYWSGQTRVSHYSASNCGLSGSVDSVLQQSDNLCAREWVCACVLWDRLALLQLIVEVNESSSTRECLSLSQSDRETRMVNFPLSVCQVLGLCYANWSLK